MVGVGPNMLICARVALQTSAHRPSPTHTTQCQYSESHSTNGVVHEATRDRLNRAMHRHAVVLVDLLPLTGCVGALRTAQTTLRTDLQEICSSSTSAK